MKNLRIFVAISLLLAAGCNRPEAEDPVTPEKPKGKYELKELTATLPEADTKTDLPDGYLIPTWVKNDRIAVIDKDGDVHQYKLESGAGTPVGTFVNVSTIADYDDISQITAIYPACAVDAAYTNTTSASIRINASHKDDYTKYGISNWRDGIHDFYFNNNDIKVAKPSSSNSETTQGLNFKFKQLTTWCLFEFDFTHTASFYETYFTGREYVTGFSVSKNGGEPVAISGNATLNLSSLELSEISETSITRTGWVSPVYLSTPQVMHFMLYPTLKPNDELALTLETNYHRFKFYGSLQTSMQGGAVLKFPIKVDQNFINSETGTYRYTVEDKERSIFYYYGTQNCFLLPPATTADQNQNINAAPHASDIYYRHKDSDSGSGAPVANGAELLWQDAIGLITEVSYDSGTKRISYTRASGVYGNAVIALKSGSDILWSYHIWCPEQMPTDLTYTANYNGESKQVMSMPLGATKDIHSLTSNVGGDADGFGLYYQWGRKDPMGRSASISTSIERVYYNLNNEEIRVFADTLSVSGDKVVAASWAGPVATEGSAEYQPISQFMQNYARAHPTTFIYSENTTFLNWSVEQDNSFWGHYQSYNEYPRIHQTYKSIFDPCPQNYRVAPADTWSGFTTTGENVDGLSNKKYWNAYGNSDYSSADNWFTSAEAPGASATRGIAFYYDGTGPDNGHHTDFYPTSGYRLRTTGTITVVGEGGYCWSSAPNGNRGLILRFSNTAISPKWQYCLGDGCPVRCIREQ